MKLSRQLSLVFILAVVLLAGSCSHKFEGKEILSTIPAESSFVVRVDAKVLLENAGCTRNSDGWHAGQGLDALLKQSTNATRKKIEYLLKLVPIVDKQAFYVFRYNKTMIATCSLLQTEAVTDALKKEFGRPDRVNGFDVYDESIVVRGNQMWMPASVKSVEEALEAAQKSSVLSDSRMMALQTGDDKTAVVAVLNNNELYSDFKYMMQSVDYEDMYKDSYDIINISLPGNEMKISGYRVNAEGTPMSIAPMLGKINTSFTTQMPPETIAVIALGKPSPEFINILLDNAGLGAGSDNIRPYIEACTGTVSVSVAAPEQFTRLLHKEDWRFTVTAQYDKEKAKEILAMAGYLADMNLYLEYIDDMLILSNVHREDRCKYNPESFNGYFICNIDLSPNGDIVTGLGFPFGLRVLMKTSEKNCFALICLDGTTLPFIESILQIASDTELQRRIFMNFMRLEND